MRIVTILAISLGSLVIGWLLGIRQLKAMPIVAIASQQTGPTIQQVQALAQLVTQRVNVSDVIESRLSGRTGTIRAVVVVKGSILIATDLSRARFESIGATGHRVVLVLPQPKVIQASLDHEGTHIFAVDQTGLWRLTPGDDATTAAVVDRAYRDAQHFIDDAGSDPALVTAAREQTQRVLNDFVKAFGSDLVVNWMN